MNERTNESISGDAICSSNLPMLWRHATQRSRSESCMQTWPRGVGAGQAPSKEKPPLRRSKRLSAPKQVHTRCPNLSTSEPATCERNCVDPAPSEVRQHTRKPRRPTIGRQEPENDQLNGLDEKAALEGMVSPQKRHSIAFVGRPSHPGLRLGSAGSVTKPLQPSRRTLQARSIDEV
jgi:hypothetical protein